MNENSPYTIEDWGMRPIYTAAEIIQAGDFVPAQSKVTLETVEDMVIISVKKLNSILNGINNP